jgi:hypothetical protein
MNTSAKGSAYENAYKRYLVAERGFRFVLRAAASKGPYDLVGFDGGIPCCFQLKSGPMSCRKAEELMVKLWYDGGMPSLWAPYVVHRTKEKEFCEH